MQNPQLASFESELTTHGYLVYTNKGVSMMPLLRQNRDVMVIEAKQPGVRCRRLDAVLFKRDNGQYVLHRVLKVRKNDYLVVGDNCFQKEYVDDAHILGTMTSVVRDGKTIKVTDMGYLAYVHLWCDLYPVRFFLLRLRGLLGRMRRMLLRCLNIQSGGCK